MVKAAVSNSVPKSMRARYDEIVALTDAVCRQHLNEEYAELARRLTAALCRKRPSPLASGQSRGWACGIVYTLGQLNFLSDPGTKPYMTTPELCKAFGVGQSTALAKSRVIREALDLHRFDPTWTLRSLTDQNPLVWMFEIDGMLMDIRDAPREVQEQAFEDGLIPYLPGDKS